MKLAGARAAAFCVRPEAMLSGAAVGALLHGPDGALLSLRRRGLVELLTDGDDLRLTRLDAAAAQRDPASVDAALRARGFFPGRRVVLIEAARDGLAEPLARVLAGLGDGLQSDDAVLLLTAEGLGGRSALRRLFEEHPRLASLGLYPEPPDAAELAGLLAAAGFDAGLTGDAAEALGVVAAQIDRGSLDRLIEKLAVFALGRRAPLTLAELAPLLPAAVDSDLDRLAELVAEGRSAEVGPMIGRLAAAGAGPVTILIAAGRHFRQLLGLATAPDGIDAALRRLRPPAFGPRRTALAAQARRWGSVRLEAANRILFETDRALRSAGERPDRALVERCLIRLAMMAGRG